MAIPTSKAELKEYALRRLGKPVLEINVSDDQVDDAIDYTLQKFQQYHYDGAERCYLKHKVTQDVINILCNLMPVSYTHLTLPTRS